jgi:hypothetical protein
MKAQSETDGAGNTRVKQERMACKGWAILPQGLYSGQFLALCCDFESTAIAMFSKQQLLLFGEGLCTTALDFD